MDLDHSTFTRAVGSVDKEILFLEAVGFICNKPVKIIVHIWIYAKQVRTFRAIYEPKLFIATFMGLQGSLMVKTISVFI